MTDLSKLNELKDWCWSVGKSRFSGRLFECRIFPRNQNFRSPVIIKLGHTIQEAIDQAVREVKDFTEGKNYKHAFSMQELRSVCEAYDLDNGFQDGKLYGREVYTYILEGLGMRDEGDWVYDE